jgi:hypothetical protein
MTSKNNAPTINQDSRGIATQQRNSTTRPSLRLAINEKCAGCIFDSNAPGTRLQQIEACTSKSCPLYNVRPRPTGYMAQSLIAMENSELGQNASVSDTAKVVR